MRKTNQKTKVLALLRQGQSLTSFEARSQYGFQRLGARIWDLKTAGHPINSNLELTAKGKYVARYSLDKLSP